MPLITEAQPNAASADLEVVSYAELLKGNEAEQRKLLAACQDFGFFYLRLICDGDIAYDNLWSDVAKIFAEMGIFFNLPLEEKMKYDSRLFGVGEVTGYKPQAQQAGIIEGKRDGFESFKVSRNGILNLDPGSPWAKPDMVTNNFALFKRMVENCHTIGMVILSALSSALGLAENQRFEGFHGTDTITNCALGLNKHPKHSVNDKDIGHNAHTDVGSITVLFAQEWGLQVWAANTDAWAFVKPMPQHAVINVADSLKFLSKQSLRSCLHRVVPHVTTVGICDRYSFAYFLRPDLDTVMEDQDGKSFSASQWQEMKYTTYRKNHAEQKLSAVQTGRKGILGLWSPSTAQSA